MFESTRCRKGAPLIFRKTVWGGRDRVIVAWPEIFVVIVVLDSREREEFKISSVAVCALLDRPSKADKEIVR